MGIVVSILGLSTSIFYQQLIDKYLIESVNIEDIYLPVILLATILTFRTIIGFGRGLTVLNQSKRFNNRIINQFLKKILNLPKSFFDQKSTGDFVARMNDTAKIQQGVTYFTSVVLIQTLIALGCFFFDSILQR